MASDLNQRLIGALLIGLSIILVFIMVFVKAQSDKEGAFLCKVVAENNMDMDQCPAHESNTSWYVMAGFVIAVAMLSVGIYLSLAHRLGLKEHVKVDTSKLDDEEKRIYELLKAHEGSMYQSDLIKETDYTKVRMTRVLDKMEGKHVIERKRRGMTNIIILR